MTETNEALLNALPGADADTLTSQEIMSHLDETALDTYVKLQETFETDGWPLIRDRLLDLSNQAGFDGANADTWEECNKQRGRREAYYFASQLADAFVAEYEGVAREAIAAKDTVTLDDDLTP